jgi:hypothetical protein
MCAGQKPTNQGSAHRLVAGIPISGSSFKVDAANVGMDLSGAAYMPNFLRRQLARTRAAEYSGFFWV